MSISISGTLSVVPTPARATGTSATRPAPAKQSQEDTVSVSQSAQVSQLSLQGQSPGNAALEPGLAERLQSKLAESAQRQEAANEPAVLMVAPQLRTTLARFAINVG